ncbi:cytochrome P450 3A41-like isoform X1 [Argiope bruennichi]|uniref:cytochrome P450 3A41-like isoform X1 n=2 Tax=Argiope bruennichi TaxID=94029 RepID=UPI002495832F|nr:cytochrome P450 3A41-like isoform X1 [Argiope bruennichi]
MAGSYFLTLLHSEMEVFLALLVVLVASVVFMVVRWAVNRHDRLKVFKRYGIPGPEPDFLSGNMNQLKSAPTPNDIITSWLGKYGNVFGYYVGEIPYIVVNDLEMLKQVFIKDSNVFINRPAMFLDVAPLNKTILALKDKRWKEVRSLLTPTFSSGKIKLMTQIVSKKVDVTVRVVEKHAEKDEIFDMYELVQGLTLDVIADCALAMKSHCQENPQDIFLVAVRDFFRYANNRAVEYAIMFPFVATVMSFISNYLTAGQMTNLIVDSVKRAIAERRQKPDVRSMDILQLMLDHKGNDGTGSPGLTDEEIIANAYIFLLAGYETTATALAFTFYLLVKHPEIQDRLYKEIENITDDFEKDTDNAYSTVQNHQYLDQVFSESLRFYPPVTGFVSRLCSEDHRVGTVIIPKGATVLAPVWDIHHDPELWPNPWEFDPERFSPENKTNLNSAAYMPFGIGKRNCIGARFAQLEAKLAIFRLVKKFKFEACEKTDDPLPLICHTVIINPAKGVYLKAVPRVS